MWEILGCENFVVQGHVWNIARNALRLLWKCNLLTNDIYIFISFISNLCNLLISDIYSLVSYQICADVFILCLKHCHINIYLKFHIKLKYFLKTRKNKQHNHTFALINYLQLIANYLQLTIFTIQPLVIGPFFLAIPHTGWGPLS